MSHNPLNTKPIPETEAMRVLHECLDVMRKKADDYQNQNSTVKQADYYPHGIQSLYDMVNTKRLRVKSLLDKVQAGGTPNHEGIEDSLKDLINYAAFSVAWLRGQIEGQDPNLDMFNKPKSYTADEIGQLVPDDWWVRKNYWGGNTTIAVAHDHAAPENRVDFDRDEWNRQNQNCSGEPIKEL